VRVVGKFCVFHYITKSKFCISLKKDDSSRSELVELSELLDFVLPTALKERKGDTRV
jgi:hypothetical protein